MADLRLATAPLAQQPPAEISGLQRAYLAVDLGAGSGRVMLGRLSEDALELEELHRFAQPVAFEGGHERWLLDRLLAEVMTGLHAAGRQQLVDHAEIRSVGVDGWGVDYGLVDEVLAGKQAVAVAG